MRSRPAESALKPETTINGPLQNNRSAFEADFTLKALAKDSGGRAFSVDAIAQLPYVYQTVAAEIANQYVLGYIPRNRPADGKFQQLSVRLTSRTNAQEVRTRRGYYTATP
jgi:VWFA-related protein